MSEIELFAVKHNSLRIKIVFLNICFYTVYNLLEDVFGGPLTGSISHLNGNWKIVGFIWTEWNVDSWLLLLT